MRALNYLAPGTSSTRIDVGTNPYTHLARPSRDVVCRALD